MVMDAEKGVEGKAMGCKQIAEYMKALKVARPYQLGAQFVLHVQREQYNTRYVRRVDLAKTADGDFVDMPAAPSLAAFDRDDCKFAALSANTGVAVTNATDSDWAHHCVDLTMNGVTIEFLCGCEPQLWFS